MKLLALTAALAGALLAYPTWAQVPPARHATLLDLTGATGPMLSYGAAAAWRLWGLDAAGRFQIGAGVRATHYFADSYVLDTQAGPRDVSVLVPSPSLTALNVAFHLRARVAGPLHVGFNLDVAGLTLGPDRPAQVQPPAAASVAPVQPVRGNVLLGGRPDRGSLNSELYAAVGLTSRLHLRAGFSHLVTAYQDDASRYHHFVNLGALGLSYQLR